MFYETLMKAAGKQLKDTGAGTPASNFCLMLQEIAEVRRFEVTCYDISENSTTGKSFRFFCINETEGM